jgi:hypothetical protein
MILEINLIKSDFFLNYRTYAAKTQLWSEPFLNTSEIIQRSDHNS